MQKTFGYNTIWELWLNTNCELKPLSYYNNMQGVFPIFSQVIQFNSIVVTISRQLMSLASSNFTSSFTSGFINKTNLKLTWGLYVIIIALWLKRLKFKHILDFSKMVMVDFDNQNTNPDPVQGKL